MSNELKARESHLNDSAHHEEAEAFMEVDWYVSEYLRCPKSDLHDSAFELRKLVGDIVESWNSRPTEPKTNIAEHGKAQYDKIGNVAIYPDNKDYKPVGKRFILVPICEEGKEDE